MKSSRARKGGTSGKSPPEKKSKSDTTKLEQVLAVNNKQYRKSAETSTISRESIEEMKENGWTFSKQSNTNMGLRVRVFSSLTNYSDGSIDSYLPDLLNGGDGWFHLVSDSGERICLSQSQLTACRSFLLKKKTSILAEELYTLQFPE